MLKSGTKNMNLKELNYNKQQKLNHLMENRFGVKINYSALSVPKAERLSERISEQLNLMRKQYGSTKMERNPKYMEMLIVKESLENWLNTRTNLLEGELETAEVVLAAKDMVDSIQNMLEDASKMLNEQLPPLVDTIRDQLGADRAESYKGMTASALQTLIDNLNTARSSLDNGARSLAGEESAAAGSMPAVIPPETDMDLDIDAADEVLKAEPAMGGDKPMGREKR
jgi:cysteinyl-tRNA synthetase